MPWTRQCANPECRSLDTQATADEIHCLVCGRLTDKDGLLLDLLAADKSGLKPKLEKIIARQPVQLANFEHGFELVRSQEAVKVLLTPDPAFNLEA